MEKEIDKRIEELKDSLENYGLGEETREEKREQLELLRKFRDAMGY